MKTPGKIHAGSLDSPRIQAFVQALREAGAAGMTTKELIGKTGRCAINSIASEARACGLTIDCKYERTTQGGDRVYRYRLVATPKQLNLFDGLG